MSNEAEHYVVKAEPCERSGEGGCDPAWHYFDAYCDGCLKNGRRAVLDDAIPVNGVDGLWWEVES